MIINKRVLVGIIILVIIIIAMFFSSVLNRNTVSQSPPVFLTTENLQAHLQESSIMNDLPESGKIQIYFGEDSYSVQGHKIGNDVLDDPDLVVSIPSSYLNREWSSLCSLVKTANTNGDLQFETDLSGTSLAWKYRNMFQYRDCL